MDAFPKTFLFLSRWFHYTFKILPRRYWWRDQSSCLHLSRIPRLTPISQKGQNICDIDWDCVARTYVLVLSNIIQLIESACCLSNPNTYNFLIIKFAVRCNCGAQISKLGDMFHRFSINCPILRKWVLGRIFTNNAMTSVFLVFIFKPPKPIFEGCSPNEIITLLFPVPWIFVLEA